MPKLHATHLLLETRDDGVYSDTKKPRKKLVFACMETTIHGMYHAASFDREPSCPTCSKAWAKSRLQTLAAAGQKLTVEVDTETVTPKYAAYKSWKVVKLNGERIGFIGFPPGFKMNWQVFAITMKDDSDKVLPLRDEYPDKRPTTCAQSGLHSLEAAMLAVPALISAGKLKTEAKVRAERDEWVARRQANRTKHNAAEAAEKAERDLVMEGLRSITEREPGHVLTNQEIDAAHRALKLINSMNWLTK